MNILLVDDSRSARELTAAYLCEFGHPATEAVDGHDAIQHFLSEVPDLVLLDVEMPGMDGYATARAMRAIEAENQSRGQNDWVPIIFLSSRAADEDIERGLGAGGDDYITKPVSPTVLRAKLNAMRRITDMRRKLVAVSAELRDVNASLRQLSSLDALTGIANRRSLDVAATDLWRHAQSHGKPLTVMLGDVDYFKRYNDYYGHQAGDECLRQVAQAIQGAVRSDDFVARYGGEEFAILLPATDLASADVVAERVLANIRALKRPHATSRVSEHLTLSLGTAVAGPDADCSIDDLMRTADRAMYRAKSMGRNRACIEMLDHSLMQPVVAA